DELHAEDLLRQLACLFGAALGDLDAAALAAAAGVDLRLDDDDVALRLLDEALGRCLGLVDGEGGDPLRNRHAVLREELFALVLVDLHRCDLSHIACASRASRRSGNMSLWGPGADFGRAARRRA